MEQIITFAGTIYSYIHSYMTAEVLEEISIHGNFVKIPYIYNNKLYYTVVPIHQEENKVELVKKLVDAEPHNEIFFNNIVECTLKMDDDDDEIDITKDIERYMGPDQIYKDHSGLIRVRDILPLYYYDNFEYINIMYDNLEEARFTNLDDKIFM